MFVCEHCDFMADKINNIILHSQRTHSIRKHNFVSVDALKCDVIILKMTLLQTRVDASFVGKKQSASSKEPEKKGKTQKPEAE